MIANLEMYGHLEGIYFKDKSTVECINKISNIRNHGLNNKITIGNGVVLDGFHISIHANNCTVFIGDGCRLSGHLIMKLTDGGSFYIDEGSTVGGANFICGEGKTIKIGKDCMIAWGIEFRTTDSHAIHDLDTGKRINYADDIVIEDHVWVGAHVTILKGSLIKRGSVVSIRSVVTSQFDQENAVLGGVPAKVLKENISWQRPLLG